MNEINMITNGSFPFFRSHSFISVFVCLFFCRTIKIEWNFLFFFSIAVLSIADGFIGLCLEWVFLAFLFILFLCSDWHWSLFDIAILIMVGRIAIE